MHKEGILLCQIVDAIGSPTSRVKKLDNVVAPLTGNTPSHVHNSAYCVECIHNTPLGGGAVLSCDVMSLFARVLIDDCLQVIACILQENSTLAGKTSIVQKTSTSSSNCVLKLPTSISEVLFTSRYRLSYLPHCCQPLHGGLWETSSTQLPIQT